MNMIATKRQIFIAFLSLISMEAFAQQSYKTVGTVERLHSSLDKIISIDAKAEIIADGFDWCEGPVWVEEHQMLLFSDVPKDTVYKWTAKSGKEVYLTPSGYTGTAPRGGEKGSNGLLLNKKGQLVLCQCGNKQLAIMDAPLTQPAPAFIAIANHYDGKKFNSPNDAAYNSKGELFFTDPPYGLEGGEKSSKREIPFQGVYKVDHNGQVTLMVDTISRPNGIAFLPGDKTVIIANSDPRKPHWYAYDVSSDGRFTNGRIFASAQGYKGPGLPDGLKIDSKGHVFATGPGGLWIMTKEGKLLGRLLLSSPASNCALSADEKTLYITNDNQVLRFKMR